MTPLFISSEFLTSFQPPPLAREANYLVVAYSENFGDDSEADQIGWFEDRTRVTDSPVIAVTWALALTGIADDGSNSLPLARIKAFSVDPMENAGDEDGDLPGEHVAMYVTVEGEILSPSDTGFKEVDAEVAEWPEIIKSVAVDAENVGADQ